MQGKLFTQPFLKDSDNKRAFVFVLNGKSCQLDLYFAKGCLVAKSLSLFVWKNQKLTFHSTQDVTKFKLNSSLQKYFFLFFISYSFRFRQNFAVRFSQQSIIPVFVHCSSQKLRKFNFLVFFFEIIQIIQNEKF